MAKRRKESKKFMKPKIIVVCGPTASGKTGLAIELAKILNGEIISADSMQIYKELDIGTAKPTIPEMSGIPHFLINIVSVKSGGYFNVAEYVKLVQECVRDILNRGKLPIICGGTGLYIDSFISNTRFTECENDLDYRNELEQLTGEELHLKLFKIDPKSAAVIHANNKKRMIRALEIYKLTGKPKSQIDAESRLVSPDYNFVKLGLRYCDREILYRRINKRVDIMIETGLVNEVENLLDCKDNIKRIGAIGYTELFDYFDGNFTLEEAVTMIKQNTRHYAKRQITWFKRDINTHWIDADEQNTDKNIENCLKNI